MNKHTHSEIANNYRLWAEYFDTSAEMSEAEFDATSEAGKLAMLVDAFGADESGATINTYRFSLPNDYDSAADDAAMLAADGSYTDIADACTAAGMKFICSTDYGADWSGTPAQFEAARAALPGWARSYCGEIEAE